MSIPKEILSADDYSNYRNIRIVAVCFSIVGVMMVLGAIGLIIEPDEDPAKRVPAAIAVGLGCAGVAGVVGGVAARRGSRRMAPLIYVIAVVYLIGFPIGTVMGIVILRGLRRYLASMELVNTHAAAAQSS